MSLDLANYEEKTFEAVKAFWQSRDDAKRKQLESGKVDQGERAGVTGGKNMDGFTHLIAEIVRKNGLAHAQILHQKAALTLPGYFRPTKLWDILVIYKGQLVAAMVATCPARLVTKILKLVSSERAPCAPELTASRGEAISAAEEYSCSCMSRWHRMSYRLK